MRTSIITIGDEILVGQIIDTNSAWIAQELNKIGIAIVEIMSISDSKIAIQNALNRSLSQSDIIIVTGGLGPTQDDITKSVLTEYFGDVLEMHQPTLKRIEDYFNLLNRPILEVNRNQAMLPKNADLIENDLGTAAGMWFKHSNKHIISLPGVPYEMKSLMEKIIPELKSTFKLADFYHRTIKFQGIGESQLAKDIADVETKLRNQKIGVAYLPHPGIVRIRLTGTRDQQKTINAAIDDLRVAFPKLVYGYDDDSLESVVGLLLLEKSLTISTVESCTGGAVAARIVSQSGSSSYFKGSIVAYSNEIKQNIVAVNSETLINYGAVSQQTVEEMALNGCKILKTNCCIATSGIAGPDGGSDEKPVGTIWIAVAKNGEVFSKKFLFNQNRERNIELTVVYALNFLRRIMLNIN